ANHPARLHPEWTVTHTDGRMYWNPGEPGVQQLIADGVREIVDRYDVDGVHIDDYFYPDASFDDAAAFAAYGAGYPSRTEWRNANTETTVRNIYNVVHGSGKNIVFGVSPIGIWANSSTTPLGSDTKGGEALIQKFADTRGWVKRGIVDYIAPQIYWNIGYEIAEYTTLVNWWADAVAGTNVKLYIGQAAYRTGNADANSPWHGVDEISRQLAFNRAKENVSGYIMYAYKSFTDNPALYTLIKELNDAGVQSGGTGAGAGDATGAGAGTGASDGATAGTDAAETVTFTDTADHWAKESIAAIAKTGVVKGYPDGTFLPDNNVKRADFVLMLMGLFDLSAEKDVADNFSDIAPDAYYWQAVASAKKVGIVTGIGDNMFDPDATLMKQDMLAMTYRALVLLGKTGGSVEPSALDAFADRGRVAVYAVAPLSAFVENGVVTGSDTGLLEPEKPATRAETVTVLWRVYTRFGSDN
ncbi:MAG: family 10 glycosylhydrolase, partial [Clostridiales Family XIII bacterium]|nr:family 10 glycosylhydrolase [Clostridiales Family XIII bacterium]